MTFKMKMKKIQSTLMRKLGEVGTRKKATIVLAAMLFNTFQLAIAAAPSEPMVPTMEDIVQTTSFSAESLLENQYRAMTVVITAYSSTPDQTDDTPFITASGTHVRDGIVAANFLPIGTKIQIPELFGDKIFVVEDRMHERFSDRVDVWFATREEAKTFGLRKATIHVL